jgi:hypothetical protein
MLGKLLCWLGVHDNMMSNENIDQYGQIRSRWGYCLRCNNPWQLDNPG